MPEVCDGVDNDCNGSIDDGAVDATLWFADLDGDGYGADADSVAGCDQPSGYTVAGGDCDDSEVAVNPNAVERCNGVDDDCDGAVDGDAATDKLSWYADGDGDGFGDGGAMRSACAAPAGHVADATDCDDTVASTHLGADETCNGVDDDCDGVADDGLGGSYYVDGDGDGFGGGDAVALDACALPSGYAMGGGDCDDAAPSINPSATEVCDGVDNSCDGRVDDAAAIDPSAWYADADGDSFGDGAAKAMACSAPSGYVADATDCDDAVTSTNPAAAETCNSVDDNCNGAVDEGLGGVYHVDADGDGFGTDAPVALDACVVPSGYATGGGDCDDTSAAVNPAATELCNSVDDNCEGAVDETVQTEYFVDADADAHGDVGSSQWACSAPTGFVASSDDCDDTNADLHPGAVEVDCNGVDDDCDGVVDTNRGLVAWWSFDEGAGTAVLDSSGNNATGVHNAAYDAGKVGTALRFDGNTRAQVDGLIWGQHDHDFTVSYWLYDDTGPNGNWRSLFHHGNIDYDRTAAHFFDPTTNEIAACISTETNDNWYIYNLAGLSVGRWNHFSSVKQGRDEILYVNGVERARGTMTSASVGFVAPTYIGHDLWYPGFIGRMDEVRVYCFGQTAEQVNADIQADGGVP